MSETASVGELESIAQAVALADGFQLLVLECEPLGPDGLHRLLDEVEHRVAELRGEPPLIRIYQPSLLLIRLGADILLLDQFLEHPATSGAITVIDGTVSPTGGAREESYWRFLFQRLNERRNAIMRNHAGTLILAMPPALSHMFLEEASDMASIRSGMFHIDGTMLGAKLRSATEMVTRKAREQPIHHGVASPREFSASDRLQELLLNLFRTSELYRFVGYNFPEVALPDSVSPSNLALAVVDRLGELGQIDRSLFERLARVRPDHRDVIDEVAHLWGYTLAPPATRGAGSSMPSDLHERLLELSPGQREAVVYLAGFARGDSTNETPERPPTSARELLGRARSEGPEALARLADAIELVTARE